MNATSGGDCFILFVYGTLMRGGVRHRLLAGQRFLREARTLPGYVLFEIGGCFTPNRQGEPLFLGSYPGMVRCDGDGGVVWGELYEVAVSRLPELDLEEEAPALYRLEPVAVEGCDGPVWSYLYQRSVERATPCPGGRWFPKGG